MGNPAAEAALLARLRDVIHDYLEDEGSELREAHAALSTVRTEVNDTLRWQAEMAAGH